MFNVEEQTEKVIDWTRNWMNEKGEDSKAIIGISGGIDSSTVAAILEKAIGKERVIAIKLPCGVQKDIDYSNKQRRIHAESFIPSRGYIKNAKSLKRILNK